jgi:bifunctional DNA-binding transcriptional regulator/antitoxin component of YhaV-PrlF toxin-antitoxin module
MQEVMDIRVAPNGRMVLPKAARAALGVTGAGIIALSVDGDQVKLTSMRSSIQRAQALYRAHVKNDQPSEALLEERRAEATKEQAAEKQAAEDKQA